MTPQTVLIVDDDPKIRAVLRNVLQDEGFTTLEAGTAAEALAALQTSTVELITLDIHLGADNGVDLAREIRRISDVAIIMVTGKDDVIDRVVGLEVGADDYITKPFHVREVIAWTRSVLRRKGDGAVTGAGGLSGRFISGPVQIGQIPCGFAAFCSVRRPDRRTIGP